HGPNEFLHIPMGKKLTASVAMVLQEHFLRDRGGKKAGKAGKSGKSKAGKRKDKK
ncbi:MAG: hypothetical protein IT456_11570, partial [Planctomycetes bacterium]|nr:hypothetical protein [Planctomycetota bacterium]